MLATISRRIRRAFGRRGGEPAPELLFRLQMHLGQTCGGAVTGCRCGGYLPPIPTRWPDHVELVALGCLSCHATMPLEESGILYREPESERPQPAPSAGVTVH
jgi:hypothetical protein